MPTILKNRLSFNTIIQLVTKSYELKSSKNWKLSTPGFEPGISWLKLPMACQLSHLYSIFVWDGSVKRELAASSKWSLVRILWPGPFCTRLKIYNLVFKIVPTLIFQIISYTFNPAIKNLLSLKKAARKKHII